MIPGDTAELRLNPFALLLVSGATWVDVFARLCANHLDVVFSASVYTVRCWPS